MGHSIVFAEKWLDDTVILFAIFEDWRRLSEELLPSSRLIPHYLVAVVEDVQGHLILLVIIIVIVVLYIYIYMYLHILKHVRTCVYVSADSCALIC